MPKAGLAKLTPILAPAATARPQNGLMNVLADGIQQLAAVKAIKLLGQEEEAPQANSVKDVIDITKTVAETYKGAAELERVRNQELQKEIREMKQEDGTAYVAGKQDADTYHKEVLALFKEMALSRQDALEQRYKTDLERQSREHHEILQGIDARLEKALAAKDNEIARIQSQAEAQLAAQTEKFAHERQMAERDAALRAEMAKLQAQITDPQTLLQLKWAEWQPTLWEAEAKKQEAKELDKAALQDSLTDMGKGVLDTVRQVFGLPPLSTPSGPERNGLPAGPPPSSGLLERGPEDVG